MNTDTPETDALAKAWQDWDSSSNDEMPQTYRELSRELERQRSDARELARELRDALFGLMEECLLPGFGQDWDTYTEAQALAAAVKTCLTDYHDADQTPGISWSRVVNELDDYDDTVLVYRVIIDVILHTTGD